MPNYNTRRHDNMSLEFSLSDEHPLSLELASLRDAATHFQLEAHRATVQLQHQSFEHASLLQHLHALENENSYLRTELQVHRASGPSGTHRDALQVQELTLALRRLSDKLDLTEKALLERDEELMAAKSQCNAARKIEDNAIGAVKLLRSELEMSHIRERELMNRLKTSDEQRKMSDRVVEEYASLVRNLEGRPSTNGKDSTRNSLDGLLNARQGLQKLLQDSNHDSEKLHAEITRLHDALDSARRDLEAERSTAQEDRRLLAQAQLELHQLQCDDNTAAKMVSRYMKFSQSSTDVLHGVIGNLKARQEAIIASYEARLHQTQDRISAEMRQSEMLRRALDELTEDISRESYGRRREIVLRLALLGKEETITERLRRWLLRSHEALQTVCWPEDGKELRQTLETVIEDAQDILSSIDVTFVSDAEPLSSAARVYVAHATVKALQAELQRETDRRLYFEYQLTRTASSPSIETNVPSMKSLGAVLKSSGATAASTSSSASLGPSGPVPAAITSRDDRSGRHESSTTEDLNEPSLSARVNVSSSDDLIDPLIPTETDVPMISHPTPPIHDAAANDALDEPIPKEEPYDPDTSVVPEEHIELPSSKVVGDSSTPSASNPYHQDTSDLQSLAKEHTGTSQTDTEFDPLLKGNGTEEQLLVVSPSTPISGSVFVASSGTGDTFDSIGAMDSSRSSTPEKPIETEAESPLLPTAQPKLPSPPSTMPQEERYRDLHSNDKLERSGSPRGCAPSEMRDSDIASLLSKLADVDERYDDLQRSFRDCHMSLQDLRQAPSDMSNSKVLLIAVERLSDYCEDARVELEIRVADEERITKGFQTLLSVPGALSDEVNEREVIQQIEAFVDGSEPVVRRMQDVLKHKLDDLQHDIASVKRAIHSSSPMLSPRDLQRHEDQPKSSSTSGWASWTGSILGPPRASSPAPSFGAVMTSPRLRQSSSSRSLRADSNNASSPFASLGLRIPMPSAVPHHSERPPSPSLQRNTARPRASNVFGLGLRGGFMQGMQRSSLTPNYTAGSGKDEKELDSDIE